MKGIKNVSSVIFYKQNISVVPIVHFLNAFQECKHAAGEIKSYISHVRSRKPKSHHHNDPHALEKEVNWTCFFIKKMVLRESKKHDLDQRHISTCISSIVLLNTVMVS
jgi:hypothetical protein